MAELPTVLSLSGLLPQLPAALRLALVTRVASTNPGYTSDLPGSLIEDIASTDVAALAIIDSARVELVNSLTPAGANAFLLNQLGQMLGIDLGAQSNTSVFVVFTGPVGYTVPQGFIVSDGDYQYVLQDGGIIGEDGDSQPLFAIADQAGTWNVPAGTVTSLVTSTPGGVDLTVVNPQPGVPGSDAETETSYRARVLQANLAASQGMARMLKTFLGRVEGVQPRLIAAQQQEGGGWVIIVGGGDPYEVANAIWTALFDISTLQGSEMIISGITKANPGEVTTVLNHGYSVGEEVEIADSDPVNYNGTFNVLAVVSPTEFTLGKDYIARDITVMAWATDVATLTFAAAHGVTVGSTIVVTGCDPDEYNGTHVVTVVPSATTLKYALVGDPGSSVTEGQLLAGRALYSTVGFPDYAGDGILTPNDRNIEVSVTDYPDTYLIPYVNPPQQIVTLAATWNTNSPNHVAPAAVSQQAIPALVEYINSVYVGQPLNIFEMNRVFQDAVANVLPGSLLTRLVFAVAIDGVGASPDAGTGIIDGDPQSYFYATAAGITVTQG